MLIVKVLIIDVEVLFI